MLNEISWYVALFQSLPEAFLMLKLGFVLFGIDIDTRNSLIIASISAIFSYLVRKYFVTYGVHTITTTILLIVLATLIAKIKVKYSAIGVLTGVLIAGILQSITTPLLLSINKMQIGHLAIYPVLNILFFIPCALIMLFLYLFSKKKNFYLFNFNTYMKE